MIPQPARERLLCLARLLERRGGEPLTPTEVEALTGWSSHRIRRDRSSLGEDYGGSGAGYAPANLTPAIKRALGLDRRRRICVVGLGRLGSAFLNFPGFDPLEFDLVAGFDARVNRVEILKSPVPLYPAYKMPDIIRRFSIEVALLCVPGEAAQEAAEQLSGAGIRGILNFAPLALRTGPAVAVRNVQVMDELRALGIALESGEREPPVRGKR